MDQESFSPFWSFEIRFGSTPNLSLELSVLKWLHIYLMETLFNFLKSEEIDDIIFLFGIRDFYKKSMKIIFVYINFFNLKKIIF